MHSRCCSKLKVKSSTAVALHPGYASSRLGLLTESESRRSYYKQQRARGVRSRKPRTIVPRPPSADWSLATLSREKRPPPRASAAERRRRRHAAGGNSRRRPKSLVYVSRSSSVYTCVCLYTIAASFSCGRERERGGSFSRLARRYRYTRPVALLASLSLAKEKERERQRCVVLRCVNASFPTRCRQPAKVERGREGEQCSFFFLFFVFLGIR